VRPFIFDFMARRINAQLARLQQLNPNAFMFVDAPGLQFLISARSGCGPRCSNTTEVTYGNSFG
jgi:hypothetical protein